MTFVINSPAFSHNELIPPRYACDGSNFSPPLIWAGAPEATKSFALIVSDADAPSGTWYHWAIYDLPPHTAKLPEHAKASGLGPGVHEAVNDFGKPGYGGPCPPVGHGVHRYRFRLLALDVTKLGLAIKATARQVEAQVQEHCLAEADLVGTYSR